MEHALVLITPTAISRGVASSIGARLQKRFQLIAMRLRRLESSDMSELGNVMIWFGNQLDAPYLFTVWEIGGDLAPLQAFLGREDQPAAGSLRHQFGPETIMGPLQGAILERCMGIPLTIRSGTPAVATDARPNASSKKSSSGAEDRGSQRKKEPSTTPSAKATQQLPQHYTPTSSQKARPSKRVSLLELSICKTSNGVELQIIPAPTRQQLVNLSIAPHGNGYEVSIAPLLSTTQATQTSGYQMAGAAASSKKGVQKGGQQAAASPPKGGEKVATSTKKGGEKAASTSNKGGETSTTSSGAETASATKVATAGNSSGKGVPSGTLPPTHHVHFKSSEENVAMQAALQFAHLTRPSRVPGPQYAVEKLYIYHEAHTVPWYAALK